MNKIIVRKLAICNFISKLSKSGKIIVDFAQFYEDFH